MIIGSHVQMKAPDFLAGSVKEALSYEANALMLYTGAPQNTKRPGTVSVPGRDRRIQSFRQAQ